MRMFSGVSLMVVLACVAGCGDNLKPHLGESAVIGGTVTGLTGAGLVLRNNGSDDLMVGGNGAFAFATPVAIGTSYAVTIAQQPVGSTSMCMVSNSAGTVTSDAPVTSVVVTCSTAAF